METLLEIARKTRQWAVSNRGYFPPDLRGMCAIASHKLSLNLSKYRIPHRIAVTDQHVWIESYGLCIDITATQFGLNPVVILPKEEYSLVLNMNKPAMFSDVNRFRKYLLQLGWYFDQIP